jgi:M3 family oligoendopeptidase
MTDTIRFEDIQAHEPDTDALARSYDALLADLSEADDADAAADVVSRWDAMRREWSTWSSMAGLRFRQDTNDAEAKATRERADALRPVVQEHDTRVKLALLDHPLRPALEERVGAHAFALWEADVAAFKPEIADLLVKESALDSEYVSLLSDARMTVRGEEYNISELKKLTTAADRELRHEANLALSQWVLDSADELDRVYSELVATRHQMATTLGYENYIELGYKLMQRVDYDQADVESWRQEVLELVVPLATELHARQREILGLETLYAWDEPVHSLEGNPAPAGDHDWMVARAIEMFDDLGHGMGAFFRDMATKGYIDLKARQGKAGGGFCTSFPTVGMPYVFANFNGTKGDVVVFTHEMGHAFQNFSASDKIVDYQWPTYEAAEIHSMSLEFLTWPQMERFFDGEDAERFRQIHLIEGLLFLPYGVAVDHFQHMVYARPEATAAERLEMWREVEALYMPWRDWGDLEHGTQGRRWQLQGHIYSVPFYYIDYTLAQSVALQFWLKAEADFDGAMNDYVALCKRGGESSFRELVRSAGLMAPFERGCLADVITRSRDALGLD